MRTFSVKVPGSKRRFKIIADYFRIENGILTFRQKPTGDGYPYMVATFAAGCWENIK